MMVVASEEVLTMTVLRSFEELMASGHVMRRRPDSIVTFVSHQWLSRHHPDPDSVQLRSLQRFLKARGRDQVRSLFSEDDWATFTTGRSGRGPGHRWFADMADGFGRHGDGTPDELLSTKLEKSFVWVDYLSVPQDIEANNDSQARAIDSIQFYIEQSSFFVVLCPSAQHAETGELCDYDSWLQRGWCRFEAWCNVLSRRPVVPLVLTEAPCVWTIGIDHFFRLCGQTRLAVVGCGEWTCCQYCHTLPDGTPTRCDQDSVLPILESMWLSKISEAKESQNQWMYGVLRMIETQLFVRSPDMPFRASWGKGSTDLVAPDLVLERIEADFGSGHLPNDFSINVLAAGLGDERLLQACVERGNDPTIVDHSGDSCLQTACASGSIAAVEYMLSLPGMTVDHINRHSKKSSYTPLHEGVLNEQIVGVLLRYRADPAPRNRCGATPLHVAAKYGQEGAVRMLLAAGAPVDALDSRGRTALHVAAEGIKMLGRRPGRLRALQCLLEHGASPCILDSECFTAVDVAARNGFQAAVDLIYGSTRAGRVRLKRHWCDQMRTLVSW